MNKEIIGTAKVSDPNANAVTGVVDGAVEVNEKNASEPVSDSLHSGELWEFKVWRELLKVPY